jgi:hypothetical protein
LARGPSFQKQVGDHKRNDEDSAAMERSARFVVVLLLRHLAAAEFTENRDRLFAVKKRRDERSLANTTDGRKNTPTKPA